jgi:hypothetical protein
MTRKSILTTWTTVLFVSKRACVKRNFFFVTVNMDFNAVSTDSLQKSLLFRAKAIRDYPAVLDVLLSIHHVLLVDDQAIRDGFTIELPPGYDVYKNASALAGFGWDVRPNGQVINVWT